MNRCPIQGESKTLIRSIPQKLEISTNLVSLLAWHIKKDITEINNRIHQFNLFSLFVFGFLTFNKTILYAVCWPIRVNLVFDFFSIFDVFKNILAIQFSINNIFLRYHKLKALLFQHMFQTKKHQTKSISTTTLKWFMLKICSNIESKVFWFILNKIQIFVLW